MYHKETKIIIIIIIIIIKENIMQKDKKEGWTCVAQRCLRRSTGGAPAVGYPSAWVIRVEGGK